MLHCRIERHDSTSQLSILQNRPLLHGICSSDPKQKFDASPEGENTANVWKLGAWPRFQIIFCGHWGITKSRTEAWQCLLSHAIDLNSWRVEDSGNWLVQLVLLPSVKAAPTLFHDDRFYKNVTLKNAQNLRTCWEEAEEYFGYMHFFCKNEAQIWPKIRNNVTS